MVSSAYVGASAGRDTQVIGRRVVATVVDLLLLGIVAGLLSAPGTLINNLGDGDGNAVGALLSFAGALAAGVVFFGYFIILEGRSGQTIGKRLAGVRVIRESDGLPPGIGPAALRTLLRIVDSIGSYFVAFVVVLISDKNQRLGDMVAKTLVVRA
jgi:uncharacterized RDD family membrane protein YckC